MLTFYHGDGIVNTNNITDPNLKCFLSKTTFEKDSFLDEIFKKCFQRCGLRFKFW